MESSPDSLPGTLKDFLAALAERVPGLQPTVEAGGEKAGNWWIDVPGKNGISIEWRPSLGFGLSVGEAKGYGEGPTEIFRTPGRAAQRVTQLLGPQHAHAATGLRAIRELYGVTQEQVATKLRKRQAAISRLETRADSKIETVNKFVRALGGRMEIRAVFPDGQMSIYPVKKSADIRRSPKAHGTVKSSRIAGA